MISGGPFGPFGQSTGLEWHSWTGLLYGTTTFNVVCTNPAGQTPASLTVYVEPTLTLTAQPATIYSESAAMLSLVSGGYASCTIFGGAYTIGQSTGVPTWSGTTTPLSQTTTYTAICQTATGAVSAPVQTTVTVLPQCVPLPQEFRTVACPAGQTGIINETRTSACPGPAWSAWSQTTNTCTNQPLGLTTKLITSTHRRDIVGPEQMFGGWGPHLGHLLKTTGTPGDVWFADDTGSDVLTNPGIDYYKLVGGTWQFKGTNLFGNSGNVQQNSASIMTNGNMILSYATTNDTKLLLECYFYTVYDYKSCNVVQNIALGPNPNYIGAAISPSGTTRVVWWSNQVDGAGDIRYIYNTNGTGWNGPYTTSVAPYNDFAYATVWFSSENTFHILGQTVTGTSQNWQLFSLYGAATVGSPITVKKDFKNFSTLEQSSSNDIFVDNYGGRHILLRSFKPNTELVYVYISPSDVVSPPVLLAYGSYARFVLTSTTAYFVHADVYGGIKIRATPFSGINGPINWGVISPTSYLAEVFDALYTESRSYQFAPVTNINMGLNPQLRQNEVLQVSN
jgi:hypothetical protein